MAQQRRRVKHTPTVEERLAEEAQKFKVAAEQQPPGKREIVRGTVVCDVAVIAHSAICNLAAFGMRGQDGNVDSRHSL